MNDGLGGAPPAAWTDLLGGAVKIGDVLAGKYRIEGLLGQGAMGFVVRALHVQLDELVAVKFLLPEFVGSEEALARFEREARAAFKIKSEHCTRVLDVGRLPEGAPFMVMEYLEGIDLGELQAERGPLPLSEAVDHLLQACDAIAEAHQLGIVHRDLKPDNLFITRRRDGSTCLKVLDFGLSKLLPEANAERQRALTGTEQAMGTAHYMSPEQWMSAKDVGPATDIWAVGVILYEAVTGHSPFLRPELALMCTAVLGDSPPPLAEFVRDAPAGFEAVLQRCMEKAPSKRYATVGALATVLAPYASDSGRVLAQRVARLAARRRGSEGEDSHGPTSRGASAVAVAAPAPAALPRLGLLSPDGRIETWAEIMAEAPPARTDKRRGVVLLLVLGVVLLALLYSVYGQ